VSATSVPPVKAGDVVTIDEANYLYGTGTLVLRVTEVGVLRALPDGLWLSVRGVEIRWDGRDGAERGVLVRVSAFGRHGAVQAGETP
jgi:hypothetical protein